MENNNQTINFVRYQGEIIPVEAGTSLEEIKEGMCRMYPELRTSVLHVDAEGVATFYVEAGDKGSISLEEFKVVLGNILRK